MLGYVLRRLATAVPTLLVIVTISFFLIRIAPGGPFDLEQPLEAKVMDNLRRIYKLDRPLIEQYWLYISALARGDFGPSFYFRDFTIRELFATGLPVSMTLGGLALLLAIAVGAGLGTLAAFRQNGFVDHLVMGLAAAGLTVPSFVVAPALQVVVSLSLGWLPVAGWDGGAPRNLVLPVLVLALPQIAVVARLMRAAVIEVLRSNPIRTLRANGLPPHVVALSAMRAAALPVISYLGPAAAALLTGSVVVETIFAIPGIGRYFVEGALNRDYTLVMGTVVIVAVFVIVFNLLVDVLYAAVDPRVRYS